MKNPGENQFPRKSLKIPQSLSGKKYFLMKTADILRLGTNLSGNEIKSFPVGKDFCPFWAVYFQICQFGTFSGGKSFSPEIIFQKKFFF